MKKLIRSAQIEKDPRILLLHEYAAEEAVAVEPRPAASATEPTDVDSVTAEPELTNEAAAISKPESEQIDTGDLESASDDALPEPAEWMPSEELEQEYREKKTAEIEQARDTAAKAGHEEGYEAGVTAGKLEYAEASERLQALLTSLVDAQNDNISALEDISIEIVFEAVTKILGKNLVSEKGVSACVREVLRHAEQQANIVLHVSPSDYRLLTDGKGEPICSSDGQEIEIRPDERVDLGGCLLETAGGSLDGRLEIQLKQLKETLLLARSHPSGVEPE